MMFRLCLVAVALPLLLANLCECRRVHTVQSPGAKDEGVAKLEEQQRNDSIGQAGRRIHAMSDFEEEEAVSPNMDRSIDARRSMFLSKWSECKEVVQQAKEYKDDSSSEDNWHNKAVRPALGVQTRQVGCRDFTGNVLERSACGNRIESVITNRTCVLKLDCIVGEWMLWLDQPDGSRMRFREIVRMPQGGGADCGVVQEIQPIVMEATAHWVPGPWGTCNVTLEQTATKSLVPDEQVDDDIYEDDDDDAAASEYQDVNNSSMARCGGGIQARQVTCVRADGTTLQDAQCAHVSMPALVQPCEAPCPRDCEVGEWSEWTPCQPTDGCPLFPVQQLTTTGYSVRHRRVKSAASGGGAPCPPLEEKRTCAAPKCASWEVLPWGPCVLNAPHTVCGPGRRTRDLMCIGHDGKEAQRAWCAGTAAPARSERCRIACSGDCVVSGWGAWGECSAPCSVPAAAPPHRTRTRHILALAAPSGWPCPSEEQLVQHATCNTHACATYSWLSTPWGPCERRAEDFVPASNYTDFLDGDIMSEFEEEEPCIEEGEMTRDVMCVQSNADVVREALCAPLKRPVSRRACTVRCRRTPENEGCKVEPWQQWSQCENSCDRSQQSRQRVVHGGPNCGALIETRDCPIPKECKNLKPEWKYSEWKDCELPKGSTCGYGTSVRFLQCMLGTARVELARCAGQVAPHLAEPCYKPCSSEQKKITCEEACKNPIKYVDKADTQLVDNCTCPKISLELSPADSDCILPAGNECGEGKMYRAAKCLHNGVEVPIEVCLQFHKLEGPHRVSEAASDGLAYAEELHGLVHGSCSVRCVRDCALGPWGAWGPCSHEANSLAAYRYRSREVIDEGSAGGRECGPTLQRSSCAVATPRWVTGEWSLCVPERGQCGSAIINRTVTCEDGSGNKLEAASCGGAGAAPALEAACRAPCPKDCVVSAWSDWSPCQMTKWGGRRDRTRVVLRGATAGGGACPALVEAEPCAPRDHAWHAAPWDDCTPLGGSPCGEGIKRRTVRCLRSDGVFVNDSFCPDTKSVEPRESWCYVPCGADCALSEWSDWDASACMCGDHAAHMRRTRQRLSAAIWPGRPCRAVEQRIPCPRTMCMKLITTHSPYCRSETSIESNQSNFCGWESKKSQVGCQAINNEGLPMSSGPTDLLEPFFCTNPTPGRFTFALAPFEESYCPRRCGCHEKEIGTQGPWGAWGPCRNRSRSRTREMITKPSSTCNIPEELLTIEWSSCHEGPELEVKKIDQHNDNIKRLRSWIDTETYHDGYVEGSGSVLAVVWTATIILGLYGVFILYRGILACLRSRQLKTITKV